ncbi:tetratricopeptide repeat protein [Catalinimonas niigatensis]|uniref:tetratricopeptide repeat protein n=1 Tax=Catalinimonas niigatensis TaxID=1397264 RepID=UPI0026651170|nr:tetratricopeptide repeat protein [Catalinimonas niigatensis]WPP51137.1 tetratricopeptide repeat protein [Catalinimonas niigatensis]
MDLNKQALLNLMSYPNEISEKEAADLVETIENYPYFQLGHALLAKVTHDKQATDAYKRLSKAAIYAPNRRKLRELFYEDLRIAPTTSSAISEHEAKEDHIQDTTLADENIMNTPEVYDPLETEQNVLAGNQDEEIIQSDEVYNELEENLRKLRESKNKFSEEEEENKKKITEETEDFETQKYNHEEKNTKDPDNNSSVLLHELTPNEEVIKPLDANQQLQNELIDKFINSQDNRSFKIKPPVDTDEVSEDLSYPSTEMADSLVSENLAEIYVKQGKKEKAIEIYQKLIWKFPQKKTYFAEIIESLKAE